MQLQLALLRRMADAEIGPLIEECERAIQALREHIRSLNLEES
jgi:hypothetical protein